MIVDFLFVLVTVGLVYVCYRLDAVESRVRRLEDIHDLLDKDISDIRAALRAKP